MTSNYSSFCFLHRGPTHMNLYMDTYKIVTVLQHLAVFHKAHRLGVRLGVYLLDGVEQESLDVVVLVMTQSFHFVLLWRSHILLSYVPKIIWILFVLEEE